MGSQLSKSTETKSETKPHDPNASDRSRRKSSVDSVLTPDFISSSNIKPIGSQTQPKTSSTVHKSEPKTSIPSEIVVVSDGSAVADKDLSQLVTFPPPFKPLIPIGYESLSQSCPQIKPEYVIELGLKLEIHLKNKSESIAKEQQKLTDRIKDIDSFVSYISNQFIIERQKRLIKVSENLSKVTEISNLIDKCEKDINNCVTNLDKLNEYLPKSLSLEKISLSKTG